MQQIIEILKVLNPERFVALAKLQTNSIDHIWAEYACPSLLDFGDKGCGGISWHQPWYKEIDSCRRPERGHIKSQATEQIAHRVLLSPSNNNDFPRTEGK